MARNGLKSASFTYEGQRYWAYGKTTEEAQTNAKIKKALLEANVKEYKNNILVKDWAYVWLERYKEGSVCDAWYKSIESTIRNKIIPAIGHLKVKNVKPADISSLYNSYSDVSFSTGNSLVQTVRQIFNAAEENDIISKSPARFIKAPKFKAKKHYRILTTHERELFFKAAKKNPEDALFFQIMYYCGLRPQEVAALKMRGYDRKARTLTVEQARKTDNKIGTTKTETSKRTIPVPDALAEILDAVDKKADELVVTAPKGGMYTRPAQRRLWERFKKAMEIENGARVEKGVVMEPTLPDDLTPYCLRHTYCTNLQDAGVPVTEAKYLMGHATIRLTADIYTHHSTESFVDARVKMNAYHKKSSAKSPKLRRVILKK